jgi:hypothetical protein
MPDTAAKQDGWMPDDEILNEYGQTEADVFRLFHAKPEDLLPKPKRRRCSFCGRFLDKSGRCVKVFYDDWNGGWDHA